MSTRTVIESAEGLWLLTFPLGGYNNLLSLKAQNSTGGHLTKDFKQQRRWDPCDTLQDSLET